MQRYVMGLRVDSIFQELIAQAVASAPIGKQYIKHMVVWLAFGGHAWQNHPAAILATGESIAVALEDHAALVLDLIHGL